MRFILTCLLFTFIAFKTTAQFKLINDDLRGVIKGQCDFIDYDQDGDTDLIITGLANPASSGTFIFLQDKNTKQFSELILTYGLQKEITSDFVIGNVHYGDWNTDGVIDIISPSLSASYSLRSPYTELLLFEGKPQLGSFEDPKILFPIEEPSNGFFTDFDNDANIDVICSFKSGNIWSNDNNVVVYGPNEDKKNEYFLTSLAGGGLILRGFK